MKVGDLARKTGGDSDIGETGIIVEITTNEVGNTVVTVLCGQKIRQWYSEFIEVLDEPGNVSQV